MATDRHLPQVLPDWIRSLAPGIPHAPRGERQLDPMPPGTLYALTEHAGWAVPSASIALEFGRADGDVHLPIGVDDPRISRVHGRFRCVGGEWWIRNEGSPIKVLYPEESLLLTGHERAMPRGYTPLLLGDPTERLHFLEVRIDSHDRGTSAVGPDSVTLPPQQFDLTERERLVLTCLAQNYLLGLPRPQPVTWKQIAADLNEIAGEEEWIPHRAANVTGGIRQRLSHPECKPYRVPGLMSAEDRGTPIGNALNVNLIRAMIQSTTLRPDDLKLLGIEPD